MFDIGDTEATTVARDPMAQIRTGLGELAGRDRSGWGGDALSQELVGMVEARERLDAEIIRTTVEWRRRWAWEADGALSPVAWLTYRAPIGHSEARKLVKAARVVDDVPQLGEALAGGDTTTGHVQALASVVSDQRRPLLAEHEAVLTDQAGELSIREYTVLVRRWAAIADDYLASDVHGDQVSRKRVVCVGDDGGPGGGQLRP